MSNYKIPVVPSELAPMLTDTVLELHRNLSLVSLQHLDPILSVFTEQVTASVGDQQGRAVVIHGDPEIGIDIVAFSHEQAWKPSTAIRTLFSHYVNNHGGVTIALPNNSVIDKYVDLSPTAEAQMLEGDMSPFYEVQGRLVESVMKQKGYSGTLKLKGYSLGGLTSLGIASVNPGVLDIASVHAIEAPAVDRTSKQLRKDFMKSGTWEDQRAAIADTNLPMLTQALHPGRMLMDYARFGLASKSDKVNRALSVAMALPNISNMFEHVIERNPGTDIYAADIVSSLVSRVSEVELIKSIPNIRTETYSGSGTHGHATGDNAVALSLMFGR